jgi:hypothetical protein
VRGEGHGAVADQGADALDGDHEGRTYQHDQNEEAEHLVLVHHPQEHREQLEEGEGVYQLVPEYVAELADRNLQNVVLVVLLQLGVREGVGQQCVYWLVLCFGFETCEALLLRVEVELALLEVEDVEGLPTIELLLVEVSDAVDGLLPLPPFNHVHVAGQLEVRWDHRQRAVLHGCLHFF